MIKIEAGRAWDTVIFGNYAFNSSDIECIYVHTYIYV